ncbi:MAG: DNA polymerase III subunit delta' [Thermaerobacter sp.]|nr:DNA polymerase III subunit delta' [Bacillota bacterium]
MRLDHLRQPPVRRILSRALATGRIAHAYLFAGEPGLGQEEAARAMAAALLCAEPDEGGACGRCPSCRKLAGGNHPDVLWMEPEGSSLKTSQVADLIRELRYRPVEGRVRCVLMAGADTMTMEAANRLLKTLEEPPSEAVLFLLAADEERLPETIRSRCQRVVFRPLPAADLARDLEDQGLAAGDRAVWLARLARGNPGRARLLAEHAHLDDLSARVVDDLARMGQGDLPAALEAAEQWAALDPADLALALDLGERALVDAWLLAHGFSQDAAWPAADQGMEALAAAWGRTDPERVLTAFARARRRLDARVVTEAALDALFLELQQARR